MIRITIVYSGVYLAVLEVVAEEATAFAAFAQANGYGIEMEQIS